MSDDVIDFNKIRQGQVAATKPELFCVSSCKYEDITLVADVHACFFSKEEAEAAMVYMQSNLPIAKSVGWYEIIPTRLSVMAL